MLNSGRFYYLYETSSTKRRRKTLTNNHDRANSRKNKLDSRVDPASEVVVPGSIQSLVQ